METATDVDSPISLRSSDVTAAAGITFRQLDYLVAAGLIAPRLSGQGGGSGNERRWGAEQVRLVRFAAILREHGARHETLAPAMRQATDLPEEAWCARVLVTKDGRIATLLGPDANGYIVDLAHCRDVADGGILAAA